MTRVFLLGFDGLNPHYVKKLVEKGLLPNFSRLMQSTFGILESTVPPLSVPAWPSIYTGLNPGNHGVYGFITKKKGLNDQYVIHNSKSIQGKTLWDILGKNDKKSILVNVPLTYPPYPINGILVSGFPTPNNKLSAYPKNLEAELRQLFPDYRIDNEYFASVTVEIDHERFIEETYIRMKARTELSLYLMNNYDWDFFYLVYTESDRFQHVFWPYADEKNHEKLPHWDLYSQAVRDFYISLDKQLEVLLNQLDENTVLFVVSDHSFESLYRVFGLNNWLDSKGYINLKKPSFDRERVLKPIYNFLTLHSIFDPMKLYNLLPSSLKKFVLSNDLVQAGTGGLNLVSLVGDETDQQFLENIISELLEIVDPETGKKVINQVFTRDELYHGEYIEDSYDLIVLPNTGYVIGKWNKNGVFSSLPLIRGNHISNVVRDGALFIYGSNIPLNTEVFYSCLDITPSILYLLGIQTDCLDGSTMDFLKHME